MSKEVVWSPGMTLEQLEELAIKKALKLYPSKVLTAAALGISVRSLHDKIAIYKGREEDKQRSN